MSNLKKTSLITLFVISLVFLFSSCVQNYNPQLFSIASEKAIVRRVKQLYGKYGSFQETSCETKYIYEMSWKDEVPEEYQNNIASRTVHFTCSCLPGVDVIAADSVYYSYGWSEFSVEYFGENYSCNFYGYYFKDAAWKHFEPYLDKNFGSFEYKAVLSSGAEYYPIGNFVATKYNSLDDYLADEINSQQYYIVLKQADDEDMQVLVNSFRYQLQSVDEKVAYVLFFDENADFDSLNSVNDLNSAYGYFSSYMCCSKTWTSASLSYYGN